MPLVNFQFKCDAACETIGIFPPPCLQVNAYILTAGSAKTINIPTGAKLMLLSCTGDFYTNFQGTASVPSGDVTNGTASELNTRDRWIDGYSSFSVVSPEDAKLTVSFYTLPTD